MLDSRLKFLRSHAADRARLARMAASERFGLTVEGEKSPRVHVLVRVADDDVTDRITQTPGLGGFKRTGRVISGEVELDRLGDLDQMDGVSYVQAAQLMVPELDASVPEINATAVHTGTPSLRGKGVIVGIIDTGVDWRHDTFRDANGNSRILRIWDQSLTPQTGESAPNGYTYGVEYQQATINNALKAADPLAVVRHTDNNGHGSHVAGIAAGSGVETSPGNPSLIYYGAAPDADLVVVAPLGNTAKMLEGIRYIFDVAQALGKPAVINLSLGGSYGPHDGTDLFEVGIDNLLGTTGRAIVKSAGNSADSDIHATGTVAAGGSNTVQFKVPLNDTEEDAIELWYPGADRISVKLTPPGGTASASVVPGTTTTVTLSNGNSVFVDSIVKHALNGDNQIYLRLDRGNQKAIAAGTWSLTLTGQTVTAGGRWHAWVVGGGGDNKPIFTGEYLDNSCTITTPGTSKEIISVASYITYDVPDDGSDDEVGALSSFSSRGPTRDGRAAPTLAAPGQSIWSAQAGGQHFVFEMGTSMAAPHITGVCALMLQARPTLTQAQLITCLTAGARSDEFTGPTKGNSWGAGKVDARAAVDQAAKL